MTLEVLKLAGKMHKFLSSIVYILVLFLIVSCKTEQSTNNSQDVKSSSKEKVVSQPSTTQQSLYTITKNAIGPYARGKAFDESMTGSNEKFIEKQSKNGDRSYYSLIKGNQEILRIFPAIDNRTKTKTDIIGEISVMSPNIKDEKGISIGSTVSDFLKTYPMAYANYDMTNQDIILSDEGHGPQYIIDATSIKIENEMNVGKIPTSQLIGSQKITKIKIVRSEQENKQARNNKSREGQEIMEKYLATLTGKYFLSEYSENYYKIHKLQGDFYVSECFEGDCNRRGKIESVKKNDANFIALNLAGVSGNMVPSWTIKEEGDSKIILYVRDYDASQDKWTNKVYEKGME